MGCGSNGKDSCDHPLYYYAQAIHEGNKKSGFFGESLYNDCLELGIKKGCTYSIAAKGRKLIGGLRNNWFADTTVSKPPNEVNQGLLLLETAARAGRVEAICSLGEHWWRQGLLTNKPVYFECALKYLNIAAKYGPQALFPLLYIHSPGKPGPTHLKDAEKASQFLGCLMLFLASANFKTFRLLFSNPFLCQIESLLQVHDGLKPTIFNYRAERSILKPYLPLDISGHHWLFVDMGTQRATEFLKRNTSFIINQLKHPPDIAPEIRDNLQNRCYAFVQKHLPRFTQEESAAINELRCLLAIRYVSQGFFPSSKRFFENFFPEQCSTFRQALLSLSSTDLGTESKEHAQITQSAQYGPLFALGFSIFMRTQIPNHSDQTETLALTTSNESKLCQQTVMQNSTEVMQESKDRIEDEKDDSSLPTLVKKQSNANHTNLSLLIGRFSPMFSVCGDNDIPEDLNQCVLRSPCLEKPLKSLIVYHCLCNELSSDRNRIEANLIFLVLEYSWDTSEINDNLEEKDSTLSMALALPTHFPIP